MMRPFLLAGVVTQTFAGNCCWSHWGDESTCGNYPSGGSGSICGNDGVTKCSSNSDCTDSPPTPAPPPPAPPVEIVGYWAITWGSAPTPSDANLGIAFSGWNDPDKAQSASDPKHDALVGQKWIDAGGGNANGRFSADWLAKWETAITSGKLSKWNGIVFDIEECSAAGLADNFASAFRTAKAAGFSVLVTVSHNAPYGCADKDVLMKSFFANADIDIVSPQLYTSGNEQAPMFDADASGMVKWEDWTGCKARLVPSLGCNAVANGGYEKTKDFFSQYSLNLTGYIVWPSQGCSLSTTEVSMI